ncbi:MAG: hypothetical protein KJ834_08200 [Alphaproteobacteria bacterium]|nr:hypothetical protein [Alphaproteobacteria bacterium]
MLGAHRTSKTTMKLAEAQATLDSAIAVRQALEIELAKAHRPYAQI